MTKHGCNFTSVLVHLRRRRFHWVAIYVIDLSHKKGSILANPHLPKWERLNFIILKSPSAPFHFTWLHFGTILKVYVFMWREQIEPTRYLISVISYSDNPQQAESPV